MANQLPTLLLLLSIGLGHIAITVGQRLPLPTRRLMAPSVPFAESFERFDAIADDEGDVDVDVDVDVDADVALLGQQLTSAVAPLSAVPFLRLSRRQPGIVAPRSGVEAALRFADPGDSSDEQESSEEDSEEPESETETEPQPQPAPQPAPQSAPQPAPQPQAESQSDYNPYRDNFNDQNPDGSYVYGYSLPNGVRRWERGFYTQQQNGLVVEGFYAQPRPAGQGVQYELRCYRADSNGYQPLAVEYLSQPPRVRRFEVPNVRCFNANRQRP
ncbi:hypothetical protein ACLKA7_007150 [Drosophila subpalustris]